MKKKLKKIFHSWFVIPKYEKLIKQKDKTIEDLENTIEFEIEQVNKYRSKVIKLQREKRDKNEFRKN